VESICSQHSEADPAASVRLAEIVVQLRFHIETRK
jgi:hypothetical protein